MILIKPYNRSNAVEYARRWALSRNPLFANFQGIGGDCTSFVSQCLFAGSCTMNYTRDFGWYYISINDRAAAWSGVEYLYAYLTRGEQAPQLESNVGPFATEVSRSDVMAGDVVQLSDSRGDYYHTVIVSDVRDGNILVCAHSSDARDRALSSYRNAGERFLHIVGVRIEYPDDVCFEPLLNGVMLQ